MVVCASGGEKGGMARSLCFKMFSTDKTYLNTHSINCVPAVTAVTAVPPYLLYCPIHSPQTSQIQFLEEASTGQCVGAIS